MLALSCELTRHGESWVIAVPITEQVRQGRAVELLEAVATPAARKLLGELAKGAAEARLTQDAKGALARLERLAP